VNLAQRRCRRGSKEWCVSPRFRDRANKNERRGQNGRRLGEKAQDETAIVRGCRRLVRVRGRSCRIGRELLGRREAVPGVGDFGDQMNRR
jgi:hypothetical protein